VIDPGRERELVQRAVKESIGETCAKRLAMRYSRCARESDLLSRGNAALVDIVRAYQDALGGFEDFCRRRLDGVMLAEIRVEARHQRNDRAAQRALADLLTLYRSDPGAVPRDRVRTLAEAVAAATFAAMTEEAQRGGEEDMIAREEYATAHEVMRAVLVALSRPLRKLMVLLYHELKTLTDAAELLEVHYNTAERWHLKALGEIRKQLEKHAITHSPERGGAPRVILAVLRGEEEDP
jgi:RNA polymerase sigma factor (sigma-70 family)